MNSTNISSNAYNFSEFASTGVDPRTGTFSFSFNITTLEFYGGNGQKIDLSIIYSMMHKANSGLGSGWSIPITSYDKDNQILYLSSGQAFAMEWDSSINEFVLPHRKLKDIRLTFVDDGAGGQLKIEYKNGVIEIVNYNTGLIEKSYSDNGLETYYDHALFSSSDSRPSLWRIRDNLGQAVEIDWWSNQAQTIITHKNGDEVYRTVTIYMNSISGLTVPEYIYINDEMCYQLDYEYISNTDGGTYIALKRIEHPSGFAEEVEYQREGHQTARYCPFSYVPRVVIHRKYQGDNQQNLVHSYTYSATNYLGFNSGIDYQAGVDTLLLASKDYRYQTTECINGGEKEYIYEYNKFHLLESVIHKQNGYVVRYDDNEYFANLNYSIKYQPANYSLVKQSNETNYNNSGEEKIFVELRNFDEYGNMTEMVCHDGSKILYEYYPASGENGQCPASNFVQYIKHETRVPASKTNGEVDRNKTYTYDSIPRYNGDGNFVFGSKIVGEGKEISLTIVEETNVPILFTKPLKEITIINNYTSVIDYSYAMITQGIKIDRKIMAHDGCCSQDSVTLRYSDGKSIEEVDVTGSTTFLEYDNYGELTKQTFSANSSSPLICSFDVDYGTRTKTIVKPNSSVRKEFYNQSGKIIKIVEKDSSSVDRMVSQLFYDSYGQLITQIDSDWFDGEEVSLTTCYEYDFFGEVSKVILPDGRVEYTERDIVNQKKTYLLEDAFSIETTYDCLGYEVKSEKFDLSGNLLNSRICQYDGYSNLIYEECLDGKIKHYKYDDLDRLTSITQSLNGQDITISYNYQRYTTEALYSDVMVNGVIVGTRKYDGLLRKLEESKGETYQRWEYKNDSFSPMSLRLADGKNLRFFYHDTLKELSSSSGDGDASGLSCNYNYDLDTGNLLSCYNDEIENTFIYNSLGQQIGENISDSLGNSLYSSFRHSLGGLLLESEDYLGNRCSYSYDEYARLSSITQTLINNIKNYVTITYDQQSRLSTFEVTTAIDSIRTELEYSPLGMETKRTVTINGATMVTVENTFSSDLLLTDRAITIDGLRNVESMEYDELRRLSVYTSTSERPPHDEYGNEVIKQQYHYDLYGNLLQVSTIFKNGEKNNSSFVYSDNDPMLLVSVTNTHDSYPALIYLTYDENGNVVADDNYIYEYDVYGHLRELKCLNGNVKSRYTYDAQGKRVRQEYDNETVAFLYIDDSIVHEISESCSTSYLKINEKCLIRNLHLLEGDVLSQFLISDAQDNVIATISRNTSGELETQHHKYMPYGQGA